MEFSSVLSQNVLYWENVPSTSQETKGAKCKALMSDGDRESKNSVLLMFSPFNTDEMRCMVENPLFLESTNSSLSLYLLSLLSLGILSDCYLLR